MMTGDLKLDEPYVGLKFESEEEAKDFYVEYSKRLGFVVRMMQRRRSGIDGRTLARRLGCNKQGFGPNNQRSSSSSSSSREGCKATILVKMEKSGKWVVTRFIKEHNHSLQFIGSSSYDSFADKERKIKELTEEIECQDRLCDVYRDRLVSFIDNVEHYTEELSLKVRDIVENVKKLECQIQTRA
ncbi:unnamed protein product [Arabidopsis thaliana]|jgi:hypothetical protein|uniref:Far-red impaired responsive (FAR1) family protein n=4 Tax=Arabidopsis thaliana TaxID=3702 RepID=F4JRH5_ARATH|nr:Far-red impaired responsive (FAR1) family protein [Arabidopsis thaliana]AEE83193.2 Far-red impaired responsive (FAR1) family protein [Arabidopsis thaliana]CAD5327728.1 unnamed protein product [Arabidopsis thaliana]VYS62463.1 unnamed protein product [Arabidopsis thaliana]|eukprot:NP_193021.2 Far-red impaired responsive (FAR1) family protein [Arabidopsis thaliana]